LQDGDALFHFDPQRNALERLGPVGRRGLGQGVGRAFFVFYDPVHGEELGVTDGTVAGTMLLEDLNTEPPTTLDSGPSRFTAWGQRACFVTDEPGADRHDQWITDGTAAGTLRLAADLC